jgi:hypothetical protein
MNSVVTATLVFGLALAAGSAGLSLRLPDEHRSDATRDVVGQIAGLVSVLLALVLGSLIGCSYSYYTTQKTELETVSAQSLRLDQMLKAYGPETKPLRDNLNAALVRAHDAIWKRSDKTDVGLSVGSSSAAFAELARSLDALQPETDAQRRSLALARDYAGTVEQSRLLMSMQLTSSPVSFGLVVILTFWIVALFFNYGLFAQPNRVVVSAMLLGALSVALAEFLVLDLCTPYSGSLMLSPLPIEEAIEFTAR